MSRFMHCDEVARELAVPTGDGDPAALAEHLAGCPACAHLARQAEAFDRLWRASRPVGPTDAAWNALWTGVRARLDAAPVEVETEDLTTMPLAASRPVRRWATAAFGLAQAAALLLGFGLLLDLPRPETSASMATVEIEPGEIVLIRGDGQVRRTNAVSPDAPPNLIDENFTLFNAVEAMASNL